MKLGKIRIIGGRWKSKKISFNLNEALEENNDIYLATKKYGVLNSSISIFIDPILFCNLEL